MLPSSRACLAVACYRLTRTVQVHIRKVKLLKSPKFDLGALLNLHGESNTDEQGQKVEREFKETVLETV